MIRSNPILASRYFRAMLAGATLCSLTVVAPANAQTLSINPGNLLGYIPLASYGLPALPGIADETSIAFDTPAFVWGGQSFTSLTVSSNGYLTMGDVATSSANQNFPNSAAPNGILSPYWTDLVPGATGAIRAGLLTDGSNTWIVIDWSEMEIYGNSALKNSFQVWLGITNGVEDVVFAYGSMAGTGGAPLTIGAENVDGTVGAVWRYNGAGQAEPTAGTQLRVTSTGSPNVVSTVPEPASIALFGAGLTLLGVAGSRRSRRARTAD